MFKLIMFTELCTISKLVMHLNSCSMDLGHDKQSFPSRLLFGGEHDGRAT